MHCLDFSTVRAARGSILLGRPGLHVLIGFGFPSLSYVALGSFRPWVRRSAVSRFGPASAFSLGLLFSRGLGLRPRRRGHGGLRGATAGGSILACVGLSWVVVASGGKC